MKPNAFYLLSCMLFAALSGFSLKPISPKPVRAIVYLSGAELSYRETIVLPAGSSEIVIEGVAPGIDENTVSAFVSGALVVDTRKGLRYPESPGVFEADRRYVFFINRISDSLENLQWQIKDSRNKLSVLQREKSLLLNNRMMRGEFTRDSLALLQASLDLLRTRLNRIDEDELKLSMLESRQLKLQALLSERKQYYQNLQNNNINGLDTRQYTPVHQIIVSVEAESAVTAVLSLRYFVSSAGWVPRYDIQAGSGKEKIQLVHRAQVYQNTGIDWKDISLVLSTSNPSLGNTAPVLNAWNLYFGYPASYPESVNKKLKTGVQYNQYAPKMQESKARLSDAEAAGGQDDVQVPEPLFTMGENILRTEYEIKMKYSIATGKGAHNVIVSNREVPVSLTYISVPKLDRDAFLMGKIANWEDLNLLPASARIYFDESYIGLTAIEPETTKDTLYLSLGRDRSIVVKRQALKDKSREQILSDIKVVVKTYEISIRNTKSIALDFEIEDQIPVTADNNIRITLLDKDGAQYNEVSGKLSWKLHIKPKDVKKLVFAYEVRYPKDKYVAGL